MSNKKNLLIIKPHPNDNMSILKKICKNIGNNFLITNLPTTLLKKISKNNIMTLSYVGLELAFYGNSVIQILDKKDFDSELFQEVKKFDFFIYTNNNENILSLFENKKNFNKKSLKIKNIFSGLNSIKNISNEIMKISN